MFSVVYADPSGIQRPEMIVECRSFGNATAFADMLDRELRTLDKWFGRHYLVVDRYSASTVYATNPEPVTDLDLHLR